MFDAILDLFKRPNVGVMAPHEVQQRLDKGEKLTVIDVRTPEEFAQGHIPGARLIPLNELPARAGEIDRHDEVILVCRSGNRSAQAYRVLEGLGYDKLRNMPGGMMSWQGTLQQETK